MQFLCSPTDLRLSLEKPHISTLPHLVFHFALRIVAASSSNRDLSAVWVCSSTIFLLPLRFRLVSKVIRDPNFSTKEFWSEFKGKFQMTRTPTLHRLASVIVQLVALIHNG
ncbi:hypothetical protein SLE2022_334750 [Rubroshorea leprosula]